MPNGGSDCCGECRYNPVSTVRAMAARETQWAAARCELRGVKIPTPFYTYCANFHLGGDVVGPIFSAPDGGERLPWHGNQPVRVLDDGSRHLAVIDDETERTFASSAEYVAWWRSAHPGESPDYPWKLHDRMYGVHRRAAGHDRPRLVERLVSIFRR